MGRVSLEEKKQKEIGIPRGMEALTEKKTDYPLSHTQKKKKQQQEKRKKKTEKKNIFTQGLQSNLCSLFFFFFFVSCFALDWISLRFEFRHGLTLVGESVLDIRFSSTFLVKYSLWFTPFQNVYSSTREINSYSPTSFF